MKLEYSIIQITKQPHEDFSGIILSLTMIGPGTASSRSFVDPGRGHTGYLVHGGVLDQSCQEKIPGFQLCSCIKSPLSICAPTIGWWCLKFRDLVRGGALPSNQGTRPCGYAPVDILCHHAGVPTGGVIVGVPGSCGVGCRWGCKLASSCHVHCNGQFGLDF